MDTPIDMADIDPQVDLPPFKYQAWSKARQTKETQYRIRQATNPQKRGE